MDLNRKINWSPWRKDNVLLESMLNSFLTHGESSLEEQKAQIHGLLMLLKREGYRLQSSSLIGSDMVAVLVSNETKLLLYLLIPASFFGMENLPEPTDSSRSPSSSDETST